MKNKTLHEIQVHILTELIKNNNATFTEMKPEDIENDQYNYHLKYLIKSGLIIKRDGKYSLSIKGKKYASNLDLFGQIQQLFKVSVALFVVNPTKYTILLQKRLIEPFYGDINGFAGKIRLGENIIDAAKRKLNEECGLTGDFTLIGVHRKMKYYKEKLVEDAIYHSCYSENPTGKLQKTNSFGEHKWYQLNEVINVISESVDVCKGDIEIMNRVINKNMELFYIESRIELASY